MLSRSPLPTTRRASMIAAKGVGRVQLREGRRGLGPRGAPAGSSGAHASAASRRLQTASSAAAGVGWTIGDLPELPGPGAEVATASPSPPADPRPGTATSITPAGDVVAVVRCDAILGDATTLGPAVGRTVILAPQPLSWFSTGDHWPARSYQPDLATASRVTLHYASGPDVVVTQGLDASGEVTSNGVLTCTTTTTANAQPTPPTTCRTASGSTFTPPVVPVAAGARPVASPSCPDRRRRAPPDRGGHDAARSFKHPDPEHRPARAGHLRQ